jgi:hypothetical protein
MIIFLTPLKYLYCTINSRTAYDLENIKTKDPDPALYLNTDPDLGNQTNADPCGSGSGSWSDFAVAKKS